MGDETGQREPLLSSALAHLLGQRQHFVRIDVAVAQRRICLVECCRKWSGAPEAHHHLSLPFSHLGLKGTSYPRSLANENV
jgi:hypothetical protein